MPSIIIFKSNEHPIVISETKVKKELKKIFDFFCDKLINILF
jgi:hypothetical protein